MTTKANSRVVIIGGGLAGLAAAAYSASNGRRVTVLEKATELGGRAATQEKRGFALNLGPHAFYRGGEAERVLAELGVTVPGAPPALAGYALDGDALRALPTGPVSLLASSLLPLGAKIELARMLGGIGSVNPSSLAGTSAKAFLERSLRAPAARRVAAALVRLSSYTADLSLLGADAAVSQLALSTKHGVRYVDGGWQTIVGALAAAARRAGVEIVKGAKVISIVRRDGRISGVRMAGGEEIAADAVIIASSPGVARALCPDVPALLAWENAAIPVKAACLDVALSRLPDPRTTFALGIDRPLYFSVHSAAARLAPEGGAVIHLARHGGPSETESTEDELDDLLERLQPGARKLVIERRYLPSLTVMHDAPQAARNGLAGRPGPAVPGVHGLFVAGDWVGPAGMLLDASLSSARAAALDAKGMSNPLGEPAPLGLHGSP